MMTTRDSGGTNKKPHSKQEGPAMVRSLMSKLAARWEFRLLKHMHSVAALTVSDEAGMVP